MQQPWVSADAACAQIRNQLGTPGAATSFLRGAQIFKLCPTHFSMGSEKFSRGASPPWLWAYLCLQYVHRFELRHLIGSSRGLIITAHTSPYLLCLLSGWTYCLIAT